MARRADPSELLAAADAGDRVALARLLSLVEQGGAPARAVGALTHPRGGRADLIGITGAPGAGKSTLTSALIGVIRSEGDSVGVLAIDPSSPFTGGAILGDRVRMGDHALDEGVFIRSMATRGHLGGLSLATPEAVRVLDAVGYRWVLLETVGVGQVEVEVAGAADTTVVVVNPGWGDAVQANKAGLMEIADVFVINKADRDGAAQTRRDLEGMLELAEVTARHRPAGHEAWRPPIVSTVATDGTRVPELWDAIEAHQAWLHATGERDRRRRAHLADELQRIVAAQLLARAHELAGGARFAELQDRVEARELDPWQAAADLLDG